MRRPTRGQIGAKEPVSAQADADLVFLNGSVYTVDSARSWAHAVAVKDGLIQAVGTDDDVRLNAGSSTEIVDLGGRSLFPGFQDAHIHPPSGGLEMLRCDLNDAYALADYEAVIAAYAADRPDAPWILGGGWYMGVFARGAPRKEPLDRLLPDRPAYLQSRDGHSAWVNSRALELAGIDASTPDPGDGRIERDADGSPSGTLHEGAMELLELVAPQDSTEDFAEGLRVAQTYLHSLGITAWQDAIVGLDGGYRTFDAYVQAAERGELTARVVGALWWDRHRGEEQIDDLVEARARGTVGRFSPTSVKIMQDGVIENFTAAMLEPYLDEDGRPTDNRGISFVEPGLLKGYVTKLDALGFQVHFHAIGDRAVREALDAVEAARGANGPNDLRHHIAHIQVIHPIDLPRFRELGVVANGQPLWASHEMQMDKLTIPFIGPERASWQYPFRSLLTAGATLAFGSDWSVSSPNPLAEMFIAMERSVGPGYEHLGEHVREVLGPEERIDLPAAIAAFTIGSAFVNHLDGVTGSIEVGKEADLVAFDRDLFAGHSEELLQASVELTLVAGERVHAAGSLA